jgi:hypothetical protein
MMWLTGRPAGGAHATHDVFQYVIARRTCENNTWQAFLGTLTERDCKKDIMYLSQPIHSDTLLFEHGFDAA